MNTIAEKLAKWFGSAPFILFHAAWFTAWVFAHILLGFDEDWSTLTLVVSLEAIFLSLFILRAENVESERQEKKIKQDVKFTKEVLSKLSKKKK